MDLFYCRSSEILMVGAAGTGKSRAALEKLHLCLCKYPGARALLARKTRESLSQTSLVTFEEKVVPSQFFKDSAQRTHRSSYQYPNGSELVLGGLDKVSKILSAEYDLILVDEATEITENDWETLLTRLRNGVMPYQQAIACCNPDAPTHWLNQRANRGQMARLISRHADNPAVTADYLEMLDRLTGVRRLRLLEGQWAAAEGRVYEDYDPNIHVIAWDCKPSDFARIIGSIDWGFVHPCVMQIWGLDHDGRMYLLREWYRTQRTIDWWVNLAQDQCKRLPVDLWVCDSARPDYLEQFQNNCLTAVPAYKSVQVGINNVIERLRVQPDGRPRLFLLSDAPQDRDEFLVEARRPWSTAQEFDSYVWDGNGKEQPVKENDDGMDAMRYAAAFFDGLGDGAAQFVARGK